MLLCGVSVLLAPFVYFSCTWGLPPSFYLASLLYSWLSIKKKKRWKGAEAGRGGGRRREGNRMYPLREQL